MADETYDVGARVTLDTKAARAEGQRLVSTLDTIGRTIRGNSSLISGMTTRLLAVGGAYVGFQALTSTLGRAARAMYQLDAETTTTRIGLSSVFSAIEGISFGKAGSMAERVYGQLTDDAIESVATTKELFEIYSGIVGPIRAAGFELEKVRDMTKDTVNAASALGVDFPQAKRDVAAMVRGAAGMDVKLFQTLRSMNLIKEDAKEFNKFAQATRIEKIAEALKKAGVGGAAFGKSLPGRVSTFFDIVQQFSRAFSGPLFDSFSAKLGQVNDYLLANRGSIQAYLARVGTEMSLRFETVFDKATTGAKWIAGHWDQILSKAKEVVERMEVLAPQLARAYVGLSIGRELLGRGFEVASFAGSMGNKYAAGAAGVAAAAAGKGGKGGIGLADLEQRRSHLGAWNAGRGWGSAGQSTMTYVPEVIGFGAAGSSAAGAAGGGSSAGVAAAAGMSGATVALLALAAAAATVGAVVQAASDQWVFARDTLGEMLKPAESLWTHLKQLGSNLWDIVQPLVRLSGGGLFIVLTTGLQVLATVLDGVVFVVERVTSVFAWLAQKLDVLVDFGFQQVLIKITKRMSEINEFLYGPKKAKNLEYSGDNRMDARRGMFAGDSMPTERGVAVPKQRPMVVNDFRNSKFSIKQDFKNADPDRILRVFVAGIEKEAEKRIRSPYAPAFSR